MKKSGWLTLPAAFFLLINFLISNVKLLFLNRLIYFLFLTFLFLILRKSSLKNILPPIVAGVSIILFTYGIVQKFFLFPYYLKNISPEENFYTQAFIIRIKSSRIFSLFTLPTLYAIICTVLIIFILNYFITSENKRNKFAWALLLLTGLFNLILTQSFGGILYLSLGILIYLLIARILQIKYLAPVLMVLFLFLSITIALRFSEAKEFEPVKLRFSNWKQAARMLKTSPFWGVGLGNYESKISYHTLSSEAKSIYAHNFILQFIAETGIIIPLFLLLFLFISRKKLKPDDLESKNVYISIFLVILFYNFIDIGFYFFSAGLAGVIALSQIYPKKQEKEVLWKNPLMIFNINIFIIISLIMISQNISDGYRKSADFFEAQKNYQIADQYYEKSLKFNPWNYNSLVKDAQIIFNRDQIDRAEKKLDLALNLYPDLAPANFLKSRIELKRRRPFRAYYYAATAHNKNKLNSHYQNLYRLLRKGLEKIIENSSAHQEKKVEKR